jgi:hypothetical protein
MRHSARLLPGAFALLLSFGCTGGVSDGDEIVCGASGETTGAFRSMEGCTRYRGSIHVSDTDLIDLSSLKSLRAVDGYVSIFRNRKMTSLHGLENLETVGGLMSISIDDAVDNLDALSSLRSVGGDLTLFQLGVEAIRLPNLCTLGGSLVVELNASLETLSFGCLSEVVGDLDISGNAVLPEHEAWRIASERNVHGDVIIEDNLSR